MRIVAVSDSHGRSAGLLRAAELFPEAELLLHLGDGFSDLQQLQRQYPERTIAGVRGNCDIFSDQPEQRVFTVEGITVLATHGHLFGAKRDLFGLLRRCREVGAGLCLFGHTHRPLCRELEGCWFLNPGPCQGSGALAAVAEIKDGRLSCSLQPLY